MRLSFLSPKAHRPATRTSRGHQISVLGAVLSLAFAVGASCQPSSEPDTSGTGGNDASGGQGTGGNRTGGSNTGGNRTGGSNTGGSNSSSGGSTGGNASGGNASGGNGGTGGNRTGGSNTGGNGGTGGNRTGGSNTGGNNNTGGATGGARTGGSSTGGAPSPDQPPPITNGQQGFSTRYWDCCKPACAWKGNVQGSAANSCSQSNMSLGVTDEQSACTGGNAYQCWSEAPWSVSDTLSYGYAAVHGSAFRCGQCYQLQFDGKGKYNANDPGSQTLKGKTMIVQVLNTGSDVSQGQFDLMIPGGGVGQFAAGCQKQFPGANLGATSGGMLATCGGGGPNAKSCVTNACMSAFNGKADMLAGCLWFANWFATADDPSFQYQKIACPNALKQKSGLSDPG